jgi:hypothetical protein
MTIVLRHDLAISGKCHPYPIIIIVIIVVIIHIKVLKVILLLSQLLLGNCRT